MRRPRRPATRHPFGAALLASVTAVAPLTRGAAQASPPRWIPQLLGAQFTVIAQYLPRFPARYSGPNSLTNQGDREGTHSYGIYFGARLSGRLAAYLDLEMARGAAVGSAVGLGGITNGDVIRQGNVQLGQGPYLARGYVRYTVPLAQERETATRAMGQLPGPERVTRLDVKLGKFALTDDFDQNRYANSTRLQFCNWGLFNNTAWDYAADTRGYSPGVMIAWVHPHWVLRFGSFLMPTFANGNVYDWDARRARGDNLELSLAPTTVGTILRVLAYENHARMGVYAEALAVNPRAPDIVADDRPGRKKYGLGLNVEQPLADSGETGAFLRLGWNDGRTEDFAFSEVDRHLSVGLQLAGTRWRRGADHLALALLVHGLSGDHRAYLAAGGRGFLLGDGALNYGVERVLEAYYRVQCGRYTEVSPALQYIANPGYNRDRGPAVVATLRLNVRY
ncbi:MAG TPA: carbohydrate porin [Gemmatimonadales bacterium]|nr:carbohydrate porin [Gemmatimonadales bacterium]